MDISALKNPYYGNDISTNFCVKKYNFFTQKFVEMPHCHISAFTFKIMC